MDTRRGVCGRVANPVTISTETGVAISFNVNGRLLGFPLTSDGVHIPSFANDYAAMTLAADATLAAILKQAA